MALSYTEMAMRLTPRRIPQGLAGADPVLAEIANDPVLAEAWIMSLSPSLRSQVQSQLTAIYRKLPTTAQESVALSITRSGHELAVQPAMSGLGCPCATQDGLGQWGALLTGLVGAAGEAYKLKIGADSAKDAAKKDSKTQIAIAKAQAEAAVAAQKVLMDAQAITSAGKTGVVKTAVMWGGIALTLVAGITAIYFVRKSGKK